MALENVVEVHDGKVVGAYAAQAKNVSYGNGSVEDALDGLTEDSGWTQIDTTDVYYRKIGNVVWIRGVTGVHTGDFATIATLPIGYRPSSGFRRALQYFQATSGTYYTTLIINTGGAILAISNYDVPFVESFLTD